MTEFKILADEEGPFGFEISGHSSDNCDDIVGKTVCAAVSSAAYMTANTVSEIIKDSCSADVKNGYMKFCISHPSKESKDLILGLRLHIQGLSEQYGGRVRIITEV